MKKNIKLIITMKFLWIFSHYGMIQLSTFNLNYSNDYNNTYFHINLFNKDFTTFNGYGLFHQYDTNNRNTIDITDYFTTNYEFYYNFFYDNQKVIEITHNNYNIINYFIKIPQKPYGFTYKNMKIAQNNEKIYINTDNPLTILNYRNQSWWSSFHNITMIISQNNFLWQNSQTNETIKSDNNNIYFCQNNICSVWNFHRNTSWFREINRCNYQNVVLSQKYFKNNSIEYNLCDNMLNHNNNNKNITIPLNFYQFPNFNTIFFANFLLFFTFFIFHSIQLLFNITKILFLKTNPINSSSILYSNPLNYSDNLIKTFFLSHYIYFKNHLLLLSDGITILSLLIFFINYPESFKIIYSYWIFPLLFCINFINLSLNILALYEYSKNTNLYNDNQDNFLLFAPVVIEEFIKNFLIFIKTQRSAHSLKVDEDNIFIFNSDYVEKIEYTEKNLLEMFTLHKLNDIKHLLYNTIMLEDNIHKDHIRQEYFYIMYHTLIKIINNKFHNKKVNQQPHLNIYRIIKRHHEQYSLFILFIILYNELNKNNIKINKFIPYFYPKNYYNTLQKFFFNKINIDDNNFLKSSEILYSPAKTTNNSIPIVIGPDVAITPRLPNHNMNNNTINYIKQRNLDIIPINQGFILQIKKLFFQNYKYLFFNEYFNEILLLISCFIQLGLLMNIMIYY